MVKDKQKHKGEDDDKKEHEDKVESEPTQRHDKSDWNTRAAMEAAGLLPTPLTPKVAALMNEPVPPLIDGFLKEPGMNEADAAEKRKLLEKAFRDVPNLAPGVLEKVFARVSGWEHEGWFGTRKRAVYECAIAEFAVYAVFTKALGSLPGEIKKVFEK